MAMDAGDSSDPYCKIALGKDVSRNGRNTQITCQLPHGKYRPVRKKYDSSKLKIFINEKF